MILKGVTLHTQYINLKQKKVFQPRDYLFSYYLILYVRILVLTFYINFVIVPFSSFFSFLFLLFWTRQDTFFREDMKKKGTNRQCCNCFHVIHVTFISIFLVLVILLPILYTKTGTPPFWAIWVILGDLLLFYVIYWVIYNDLW